MKIYEITFRTEISELEICCTIGGDYEAFEDIERDYTNGVDINHCSVVVNAIDHYSCIAAEDFAFGYHKTPGIIPADQPCVYHKSCGYWIDWPMKWSDTIKATWDADPKI